VWQTLGTPSYNQGKSTERPGVRSSDWLDGLRCCALCSRAFSFFLASQRSFFAHCQSHFGSSVFFGWPICWTFASAASCNSSDVNFRIPYTPLSRLGV